MDAHIFLCSTFLNISLFVLKNLFESELQTHGARQKLKLTAYSLFILDI